MRRFKYSIVLGLALGIIFLLYMYIAGNFDIDVLVVISVFLFVFTTLSSYFKMFSKVKNEDFQELQNIIYSDSASHYKGRITIGGELYLSNTELIFQTNSLGLMYRHEIIIALTEISQIQFEKTLGIINNGLNVITNNGITERFIVSNRESWLTEIEKASINL